MSENPVLPDLPVSPAVDPSHWRPILALLEREGLLKDGMTATDALAHLVSWERAVPPPTRGAVSRAVFHIVKKRAGEGATSRPLAQERNPPMQAERIRIDAQRFDCPSCGAATGEPCRLNGEFPSHVSHENRHRVAERAAWGSLWAEWERNA